jgi:uncharacterized membrane protein
MLGIEDSPEQLAEQYRVEKKANNIFIASLISLLFCCIGGIIATYFANQAKNDAALGNIDSANRNINLATGWMIASFVIGILVTLGKISGSK